MPELQYVGKPATRLDALEKVLGTAKYAGDYYMPGMLYARALRSTLPHARIVRLDVTPARQVPGVLAAITCDDFVNHGRFGFPIQDMSFETTWFHHNAITQILPLHKYR